MKGLEKLDMTIGVVGRKCGMTRVYTDEGTAVPVTVIEVLPNRVTRVLTEDTDGYTAVQVTTDQRAPARLGKPVAGHFAKVGVEPGKGLWEFRISTDEASGLQPGAELKVDRFASGQFVDVIGTTIGKGYAGVIKRHHFSSQDATHGNSLSHRAPGSIGQRQFPGRVFPGKRMAGHLGDERCTMQNLEVVRVDAERNLILVKGSVPGAPNGRLLVKPAVKTRKSAPKSEKGNG
jgi:large subunit ribosomal protein L3